LPEEYVLGDEEDVDEGACTNPEDMAAIPSINEATNYCGEVCPATAPNVLAGCYTDCLNEQTNVSAECVGCFGQYYGCMMQFGCLPICENDNDDPACQTCLQESGCIASLAECTGLEGLPDDSSDEEPELADGACTPQEELFSSGEFYSNYTPCMSGCAEVEISYPQCLSQCASQAGANWDCAQCFGAMGSCAEENCELCMNPMTMDPASCMFCLEDEGCNEVFTTCSGMTPFGMMGTP